MAAGIAKSENLGIVFYFSRPSLHAANSVSATYRIYLKYIQFSLSSSLLSPSQRHPYQGLPGALSYIFVGLPAFPLSPSIQMILAPQCSQSVFQKCQSEHVIPLSVTLDEK